LIILLSTLRFLPETKTTKAKTKVKSATLDPNNVPNPNDGIPSMAEVIDMKVSGKTEIIATIIKPTIYLDKFKLSATLVEYLIAKSALFIKMIKETTNKMNDNNINKPQIATMIPYSSIMMKLTF